MLLATLSTLALAEDPLSQYATRRLNCWAEDRHYSTTTISDDGVINSESGSFRVWGVKDGYGTPLDTVAFAGLVGDDARLAQLRTQSAADKKSGRKMLMIGGGVGLAGLGASAYGWLRPDPKVNAAGVPVGGGGGSSFALTYGALLLGSGGIALASYGYSRLAGADTPLRDPSAAYDYSAARARCEAYNGTVRQELGLTPADTQSIDSDAALWDPPDRETGRFAAWTTIGPGGLGLAGTF